MSTAIALKQQQEDSKSGHVSTLTKEQAELLRICYANMFVIYGIIQSEQFQNYEFISAMEMYSPEDLRKAFWILTGADDPDILLLRFLRARKWDVEKAIIMLISTLKWRLQFDVNNIIKGGELGMEKYFAEKGVKGLSIQFTSGKSFVRGTDKEGRPITYVNVKAHKKDEQNLEVLQMFTIYVMETVRLMIQPPIETGCLIFNMEGFSLANMHDFENINKKWIEGPDDEQIINERNQLKARLRKAQLDLDPYIRPKTYYHRIGILDDERNVNWNYNN
ncbi:19004_t:CDS:2 [Rhizophagus irregularis]|nr:19004_t:CDS:2 [Rhizophagus irregularis]